MGRGGNRVRGGSDKGMERQKSVREGRGRESSERKGKRREPERGRGKKIENRSIEEGTLRQRQRKGWCLYGSV